MAEELTFLVEDARIIFRNFAGAKSQYNAAGDRNFAVILDDETAARMAADGWNIKFLEPRDEDDEGAHYIQVKVSFSNRPPTVVLIAETPTGDVRTNLTEDTVDTLDIADISKVDLFCRGYNWVVGDKSGLKAYLKSMFVHINVDPLQLKYMQKGDDG